MNKFIICILCALSLCACSDHLNVEYRNEDSGCMYSENKKLRHQFTDFFGARDYDVNVKYTGVDCATIVNRELKNNSHKKPYDTVSIENRYSALNIDVDSESKK